MKKIILLFSLLVSLNTLGSVNSNKLVAAVLIAEAGGEGKVGINAVFEVIETRGKIRKKPLSEIVTEKFQFSCLNKYRNDHQTFINRNKKHPMFNYALWVVNNYKGNITKGANFYHTKTVSPSWSKGYEPIVIIGNHKFFLLKGHY